MNEFEVECVDAVVGFAGGRLVVEFLTAPSEAGRPLPEGGGAPEVSLFGGRLALGGRGWRVDSCQGLGIPGELAWVVSAPVGGA